MKDVRTLADKRAIGNEAAALGIAAIKAAIARDGEATIIVATGARPRSLPGIEPDGKLIWTYFEAMKPAKFPKSLVIMGSGAIGSEFASFYLNMGSQVTLLAGPSSTPRCTRSRS